MTIRYFAKLGFVMDESDRTFIRGNRNPTQYGFSLRASNGVEPDREAIEKASLILGRESFFVDKRGFECELIAAAIYSRTNRVAYVESRAKQRRGVVHSRYLDQDSLARYRWQ